jgi:hypothetical protein
MPLWRARADIARWKTTNGKASATFFLWHHEGRATKLRIARVLTRVTRPVTPPPRPSEDLDLTVVGRQVAEPRAPNVLSGEEHIPGSSVLGPYCVQ